MALFSKEKLGGMLDKAKETAAKAGESAKTGLEKAQTTMSEKREEARLAKLPQEGGLIRYEVTYKGGHPEFTLDKKKSPYIVMDIMPDRFSFLPKGLSEEWFTGFDIPYDRVVSLEIVERTISTSESLLSSGNNAGDLRQKNVIEITYLDDENDEFVVRNEMLTGTTVMGQAKVCLDMLDLLRTNKIIKLFRGKEAATSQPAAGVDITEQLEKLAKLKEQGILSEEEFTAKKTELLAKM